VTEIARMRFKSATKPREHGTLALYDDGTFQIKPSADLRGEMARLEEVALARSRFLSYGVGGTLIALGLVSVAAGWCLGRILGSLGARLSKPRPIGDVEMMRDDGGGVHVQVKGIQSRFQTIQMGWTIDEILKEEADEFVAKLGEMKREA
jgi:hypothetical protein